MMIALVKRHMGVYFSNVSRAIMSCLGALIGFFIYVCFLQKYLLSSLPIISNKKQLLDLWMLAGLITIAGITTSFHALSQFVIDQETHTAADFQLTNVSPVKRNFSYIVAATLISFFMQFLVLVLAGSYFKLVDKADLPVNFYLPAVGVMFLGGLAATLANQLLALFINSSTTYSHWSSIMSAASGFIVATYMPYGMLTKSMQILVKLIPSSYEAASLRSLLLNDLRGRDLSAPLRIKMLQDLAIHFEIKGQLLTSVMNTYVELVIIAVLLILVAGLSVMMNQRKK